MLKYYNALKENVCCLCIDSDEKGSCSLSENENCAIQIFLADIVSVAHSSGTENIESFKNILRKKVCTKCKASDDGEFCYLREDANCALDRYFPLIVDTIHKVDNGLT